MMSLNKISAVHLFSMFIQYTDFCNKRLLRVFLPIFRYSTIGFQVMHSPEYRSKVQPRLISQSIKKKQVKK